MQFHPDIFVSGAKIDYEIFFLGGGNMHNNVQCKGLLGNGTCSPSF